MSKSILPSSKASASLSPSGGFGGGNDDVALPLLADPALRAILEASVAPNTKKAYASDFADFVAWCEKQDLPSLPSTPATVIAYLHHLVTLGLRTSTLERRLVSITKAHELAAFQSPAFHPLVKQFWKGVVRTKGRAKDGAEPRLWEDIRAVVSAIPADTPLALRDKALLLCGWWGGFRVSELASMQLAHVSFVPQGAEVFVPRSKGDQEGEGAVVTLAPQSACCPVSALRTYLAHRGEHDGALWQKNLLGRPSPFGLSDEGITLRLRHWAAIAGFAPSSFSPHSLRAGIATQLALWDVEERLIQRHLRHKNVLQTRRYIRLADRWKDNALLSASAKIRL